MVAFSAEQIKLIYEQKVCFMLQMKPIAQLKRLGMV